MFKSLNYTLVDIASLFQSRYGDEFADWIKENMADLGFLTSLAAQKGVALYGSGFGTSEGNVRISLANFDEECYSEIACRLFELMDNYYADYNAEILVPAA